MRSPFSRLEPIPLGAVEMAGDSFWAQRMNAGRAAIPTLIGRLEEHGVVDNFRRMSGKDVERKGFGFTDSDLYKVIEAAAWALASGDDPVLRETLDEIVDVVAASQAADGYLGSAFGDNRYGDLQWSHELYSDGHFIEAAVAHHEATGDDRLLAVATRLADHLCAEFGPGAREQTDGHPEIEPALLTLYRATGNTTYLDLARFFLERVDHRSMPRLTGHAVRALYYCCGLTDLVAETGDEVTRSSIERFWDGFSSSGIYVTGGVGGRWVGESIGRPYELPNESAYAETCGAAASVMWNRRMLGLTGDARHADLMERSLLNGFLAGVSLAGDDWFYVNRLAWSGGEEIDPWGLGPMAFLANLMSPRRQPWYDVTCCPSNAVRLLASLPGYIYGASDEGVWAHLYAASTLRWRTPSGKSLVLTQDTGAPWKGATSIAIGVEDPDSFSVFVRIPGWSRSASVFVNGKPHDAEAVPGSYLEIRREWSSGDEVAVELDDRPLYVESDPRLTENRGSVAIQRGPIVYCLEGVDNPGVDLFEAAVDPSERLAWSHRPDVLGGVTVVTARGTAGTGPGGPLYARVGTERHDERRAVELTAIPYYAWANREPSPMTVWIRRQP